METPEKLTQAAEASERAKDHTYEYQPNQLATVAKHSESEWLFLAENSLQLRINFIGDGLFRFRYAIRGQFERDFSYVLNSQATFPAPSLRAVDEPSVYKIETKKVLLTISKADLRFKISDHSGTTLLEQAVPFFAQTTILKGTNQVKLAFVQTENDTFYGLGDKSCPLNLKGQKLENWNTDSFAYGPKTDPLYRSIPFFYGLRKGQAYGVFLHNTHRTQFDFGKSAPDSFSFEANGGEMDFFFLYGPELDDVSTLYHELTGLPELPPIWALGFHQCRWSYYPESVVRALAAEFRERQIPCDAIYLDIDYMDGYRCFTWNKEYFPDPKTMIADLKADGFQTVVMIDPGLRYDPEYEVFQSGMKQDVFCKRASGEVMIAPVWPPACVFPDFTKPETRQWWGRLYRELYKDQDVSGFWNDMNEPAVFKIKSKTFPEDVLHYNEGAVTNHKRIHNIYGLQMTRASYEGFKDLKPHKRPFLLTRATFSGGQRYASVWTGDNVASWEHLKLASTQCQRLSISGFSFCGTDIGGFDKNPDGELFTRWLQLGIFHPLYRVHSMGNNFDGAAEADADVVKKAEQENRQNQEPWSYGEPYTGWAREAINFRYQLLPYLYTAFWQHIKSGSPVIKSLIFYDQTDDENIKWEDQFVFNDQLLVCPVTAPDLTKLDCYLPKGEWLDYWSGQVYKGQKQYSFATQPDRIPVFVKAGSVIPNYPVQQYTGERTFERIALRVYAGANGHSYLYEDEGEGYAYQDGNHSLRQFEVKHQTGKLLIRQHKSGQFPTAYGEFEITLYGLSPAPKNIRVDGKEIPVDVVEDSPVQLTVPAGFFELEIR